jgi:hypothetical protein
MTGSHRDRAGNKSRPIKRQLLTMELMFEREENVAEERARHCGGTSRISGSRDASQSAQASALNLTSAADKA